MLSAITGGSSEDLYYGGFDGTWTGKIHSQGLDLKTQSAKEGSTKESKYRLVINGTKVSVFRDDNNAWKEVKPNAFRIQIHKTSAVVSAIDSSTDVLDKTGSGGWVETWTYTITHKDNGTLYVYWVDSINNYLEPPDKEIARFIRSGFGEMTRSE